MSRLKKTFINILMITVLFFLFIKIAGLYFTPMSAHKNSERSSHYGPSEVVHIEEYKNEKYLLSKYDKWISCNTVRKTFFFFWISGTYFYGFENDVTKDIDYSWNGSDYNYRLFGIRNNNSIEKIEFTMKNGDVLSTTTFYDDLFLITFKEHEDGMYNIENIKGYDKNNNIIYEK